MARLPACQAAEKAPRGSLEAGAKLPCVRAATGSAYSALHPSTGRAEQSTKICWCTPCAWSAPSDRQGTLKFGYAHQFLGGLHYVSFLGGQPWGRRWALPPSHLHEAGANSQVRKTPEFQDRLISNSLRAAGHHVASHTHADLVSIMISKAGRSAQSAVTYVLCPYEFFAYLIYITDTDKLSGIGWIKKENVWLACFKGQQSLYKHSGVGWESVSKEERYVKVISRINLRYTYRTPDKTKFTRLQVNSGIQGCIVVFHRPDKGVEP